MMSQNLLSDFMMQVCLRFAWATPDRFVTPQTAYAVVYHLQSNSYAEEVLVDAIHAILEANGGQYLAPLANQVSRINPKALKELQKKFKHHFPHSDFANAVLMYIR